MGKTKLNEERLWLIGEMAENNGWEECDHQPKICMVSYRRDGVRMNVYYSKMTVSTSMRHPVKGNTQLFRRNLKMFELEALFNNPRCHTNKGYYERKKHL